MALIAVLHKPTSLSVRVERSRDTSTAPCSCGGRSPGRGCATTPWAPAFAGAQESEDAKSSNCVPRRGVTFSKRSAEHGFTPLKRSAENGFTLLEMLVALAIFSLAGLALVRLQAFSARSAIDLRERTMSEIVARNLMVERLTDPNPPSSGSTNGTVSNAGRTWTWTQGVAPLQDPRLLGITIRVNGAPGTSPAVISFVRPATT